MEDLGKHGARVSDQSTRKCIIQYPEQSSIQCYSHICRARNIKLLLPYLLHGTVPLGASALDPADLQCHPGLLLGLGDVQRHPRKILVFSKNTREILVSLMNMNITMNLPASQPAQPASQPFGNLSMPQTCVQAGGSRCHLCPARLGGIFLLSPRLVRSLSRRDRLRTGRWATCLSPLLFSMIFQWFFDFSLNFACFFDFSLIFNVFFNDFSIFQYIF